MTTFFTIFFILVLVNAALLIFSIAQTGRKSENVSKDVSELPRNTVYPLDLSTPDYRKAI
jgi:hypothetical protein